jgi:hypothetical protein
MFVNQKLLTKRIVLLQDEVLRPAETFSGNPERVQRSFREFGKSDLSFDHQ